MQELLVLDAEQPEKLRSRIEGRLTVVQEISPRMVVVEGDAEGIRFASQVPGVTPGERIESSRLSQSEKLFVDAWSQRKTSNEMRRFEGLNWGTKGFKAP